MTDHAKRLQADLHRLIPISQAMGIIVGELAAERLVLTAPLARNHNHAGTGFAGSLYSLASLAGWAFLRQLTEREGLAAELVLGEARIRYDRPAAGDLGAEVVVPVATQRAVLEGLRQRGKARLPLEIAILAGDEGVARFSGQYFARLKSTG